MRSDQRRQLRVVGWVACVVTLVLVAWLARPAWALQADVAGQPSTGWPAHWLQSDAPWLWFLAAFLTGLALNLTPCVYPMIPVTLAFFSGQWPGRTAYTIRLACMYVLGISLMYAALGVLAAKSGALLGSWLQQPLVLVGIAIVIVGLALSMFGLYELRPPSWVVRRFGQASSGSLGALAMGLSLGVIAAPCLGPSLAGMLLFVGQRAQLWLGFGLFLAVGLGMGLPYVLLSIFADRLAHWPKSGAWMVWVKKLLGVLLIGLAFYLVRPVLGGAFFWGVMVVWLLASGVYLGWLDRTAFSGGRVWIKRGVGLACVVAVAAVPAPRRHQESLIAWEPYTTARFEQARQAARPVLVDVYADWCMPCVELDQVTFRNPLVAERLTDFVALRIDATRDVPQEAQALLDRYGIYGVPTVLLFDAAGREREELRVTGFVNPEELVKRLTAVGRS
ncbi:MAG: thioredoxin family protein [Candidatus Omnitrophica bacterium]|nr:thioredoxin family protein [Candidatus Omnitrophota bacterium]